MKITTETAKVYKLRGDEGTGWSTWAVIILRSWKGGGSIDVQSDYGNYAYIWGSIGNQDIRDFLCKVDYSYFMGKAHHSRGYVTDWEKTAEDLKRQLLEARREGMDADEARECFDALEAIDKDDGFYWQAREYPALYKFASRCDHPTRKAREAQCNGFWERIWPAACKYWKEEMESEAAQPPLSPQGEGSTLVTSKLPEPGSTEGAEGEV